jgi:hypothetical protein
MPYPYFREPHGFLGRPLLALVCAVGMGWLLGWARVGLPIEIAAATVVFLTVYLWRRSKKLS